jgi:hypothetical protein
MHETFKGRIVCDFVQLSVRERNLRRRTRAFVSLKHMGGKNWIQNAINPATKGALHRSLHVPLDKKIPMKKLDAASKKGGKLGKRARLAETLRKMHK